MQWCVLGSHKFYVCLTRSNNCFSRSESWHIKPRSFFFFFWKKMSLRYKHAIWRFVYWTKNIDILCRALPVIWHFLSPIHVATYIDVNTIPTQNINVSLCLFYVSRNIYDLPDEKSSMENIWRSLKREIFIEKLIKCVVGYRISCREIIMYEINECSI